MCTGTGEKILYFGFKYRFERSFLALVYYRPDGIGTITSAERDKFFETRERLIRVLEHDITNFRFVNMQKETERNVMNNTIVIFSI